MLRVRSAERRFGRRQIFCGLDLDVPAGTRLLVVGSNGSGKTTLLRCLSGTLTLTAGSATVSGLPVGSLAVRRLVGACLNPEGGGYKTLSAHDNLNLAARLRSPRSEVKEAVARVEQERQIVPFAGLPMRECSSGMRARVASGHALIGDPSLLLLDEPGRSLDDAARALLWAAWTAVQLSRAS